jgi:uncharacterized surface protein with fasciclin (FAS1) repeats
MKRELRNEKAELARRRVVQCRFAALVGFALPIRVRINYKTKTPETHTKKIRIATVAALVTAFTLASINSFAGTTARNSGKAAAVNPAKPGTSTIVGLVLANDGEFDVLQAAVVRAGLVDALNGKGQFTVFAPTDAAFIATLDVANEAAAIAAVNSLPIEALTNILLYHVTEGRRTIRNPEDCTSGLEAREASAPLRSDLTDTKSN